MAHGSLYALAPNMVHRLKRISSDPRCERAIQPTFVSKEPGCPPLSSAQCPGNCCPKHDHCWIRPALASLSIFVFLSTWNEFLQPLVFLRSQENFTVQLWLSFVSRVNNVGQPAIVMAGSVLASIPIVIMFAVLQRHFIAGLTAGSNK